MTPEIESWKRKLAAAETPSEREEIAAVIQQLESDEENKKEMVNRQSMRAREAEAERLAKEISAGVDDGDDLELPDTDDIKELARSATPKLVRKAIKMAYNSENLTQVLSVLKEIADRGYGKAEQSIKQSLEIKTPFEGMKTEKLLELRDELRRSIAQIEAAGAIPHSGGVAKAQAGPVLPILEAEIIS